MFTSAERQNMIGNIQRLPANLEVTVQGLNERQAEKGW